MQVPPRFTFYTRVCVRKTWVERCASRLQGSSNWSWAKRPNSKRQRCRFTNLSGDGSLMVPRSAS